MEVVVSYIKVVYLDLSQCCEAFIEGTKLLEQCLHDEAVDRFKFACDSVPKNHNLFSKYHSYYGFSRLLSGKHESIEICREAVDTFPFDGDICMNLVRAEIFLENRRAALDIIKMGLRYSQNHAGLHKLRNNLGVRKRKPLPFLPRNNSVNVALGRIMRKS